MGKVLDLMEYTGNSHAQEVYATSGILKSLDLEESSSQYAYVNDNADVSITGDFTIEAWIKLEELVSDSAQLVFSIVSKYVSGGNQREYRLWIDNNNKMAVAWTDNGVFTDHASQFSCDTAFDAGDVGVWRHVAVVVDVSVPSVTFYIDGVAQEDTSSFTNATSVHDGTAPFMIGAHQAVATPPSQFFDGLIDEVRLWNDIRSEAEIQANYQGRVADNAANLTGSWKLDDDYTDSCKSSDLTAVGSPVFSADVPFEVLQCYSESTIKQEGDYSLKVIAKIIGSLNDTLTRTVSPTLNLSNIDTIKFGCYASRTGINFQLEMHDSGGATGVSSVNILTTNAWQTETWNISGIANADKDAINQIVIKTINADTGNVFYFDNIFGEIDKTFSESLTLSEPSYVKGIGRGFAESLTLSEPSYIKGVGREFSETLTLSEVYSRQWAINRVLSDAITLSEVAVKAISLTISEAIALSEVITKAITRTFTETITLTDAFTKVLKWLEKTFITSAWNKLSKITSSWTKISKTTSTWQKKY